MAEEEISGPAQRRDGKKGACGEKLREDAPSTDTIAHTAVRLLRIIVVASGFRVSSDPSSRATVSTHRTYTTNVSSARAHLLAHDET